MKQGLRVLAVGKSENREDELIFLGLIGITDPPRQTAIKGIELQYYSYTVPVSVARFEIFKIIIYTNTLKSYLHR